MYTLLSPNAAYVIVCDLLQYKNSSALVIFVDKGLQLEQQQFSTQCGSLESN